jgi:hypothetical protein
MEQVVAMREDGVTIRELGAKGPQNEPVRTPAA